MATIFSPGNLHTESSLSTEAVAVDATTVDAQALAINALLNLLTKTIAGVWDLEPAKNEVPKAKFVPHNNSGAESVIDEDDRVRVKPEDFATGGKYRSILKLFMKYKTPKGDVSAHGTGWLIRPDVMITAGHNAYAWTQNLGRATEIKAYAGYNGASSISDPSVEFRIAKRVVTTSQWLSNRGSRAHDIAIVQFDKPFTSIQPFQYIETPPKGSHKIGVVGYPADKIDSATNERGGFMYELFEETTYDITEDKDTMLKYMVDSAGGNSGGPVLRGTDMVAIGVHVYGGAEFNSASVLGRYGNPVQDLLAALTLSLANPGEINLVPVSADAVSQQDAATGPQAKEIAVLGDNVIAPSAGTTKETTVDGTVNAIADPAKPATGDKVKPEFGFGDFFPVVRVIGSLLTAESSFDLGPQIGAVVLPQIISGVMAAQGKLQFDMSAATTRAELSYQGLKDASEKVRSKDEAQEEGWINIIKNVGSIAVPLAGKSWEHLKSGNLFRGFAESAVEPSKDEPQPEFFGFLRAVGESIFTESAIEGQEGDQMTAEGWWDSLIGDLADPSVINETADRVAVEIARGLVMSTVLREGKTESAVTNATSVDDQAAFIQAVAEYKTGPKEEGFIQDAMKAISKVGSVALGVGARIAGRDTAAGAILGGLQGGMDAVSSGQVPKMPVPSARGPIHQSVAPFTIWVGGTAVKFESAIDGSLGSPLFDALRSLLTGQPLFMSYLKAAQNQPESAMNNQDPLFEALVRHVFGPISGPVDPFFPAVTMFARDASRQMIARHIFADQLLTARAEAYAKEPKEEFLFIGAAILHHEYGPFDFFDW